MIETQIMGNDVPAIMVSEFSEASAISFTNSFLQFYNKGYRLIPVYINSYGGEVFALAAMLDIIETHSDVIVPTITLGKAMSCGQMLLSFGTKGHRYVGPNAHVMVHEVSNAAKGKLADLAASLEETNALNKWLFERLRRLTGIDWLKRMNKNKNVDIFLNAKSAVQHKLADHIGVPKFEATTYTVYSNSYIE